MPWPELLGCAGRECRDDVSGMQVQAGTMPTTGNTLPAHWVRTFTWRDVAAIERIGLALVRSATAAAATASVVVG
jgi:hypothetical protein